MKGLNCDHSLHVMLQPFSKTFKGGPSDLGTKILQIYKIKGLIVLKVAWSIQG